MLTHKSPLHIILCLTLLALTLIGPMAQGQTPQGICLYREPAPPQTVLNDGTGVVNFCWRIDYATKFNQNYILEIVPPSGKPFIIGTFPGKASPIEDGAVWTVPPSQDAGCYYGRLTFFSDWCIADPDKFEDRALVGFIISSAARLKLFKYLDANGDGDQDASEIPLQDWEFDVVRVDTGDSYHLVTDASGWTPEISVPVADTGLTTFRITETLPPGWEKTAPSGSKNPVDIQLGPGDSGKECFGNWQPITISGYKYLDDAETAWTTPPTGLAGLADVTIHLCDLTGKVLYTDVTDANGHFQLPSKTSGLAAIQWQPGFKLVEEEMAPEPPDFLYEGKPTVCSSHELDEWPGEFYSTAAYSLWQKPKLQFALPGTQGDEIVLSLPAPTLARTDYDTNEFYNRHPGRIWGFMCPEALALSLDVIDVAKSGVSWPGGNCNCCDTCGFYCVPTLTTEHEGIRPGTHTLTPPPLPSGKQWVAVDYKLDIGGHPVIKSRTNIGSAGSYNVPLPRGGDIRVDFFIDEDDNTRQCMQPVTFTQEGWKAFAALDNPIIQNGMIFNKFKEAFKQFSFYGSTNTTVPRLIVGSGVKGAKTITFEATTSALQQLVAFLPQTGNPGKLDRSYVNPRTTSAGVLAGEIVALQMNIAYNDVRLMPRTPGYDFEKFTLLEGFFKGRTVGEVLDIASAILSGDPPSRYGLPKDPSDPQDTGYNALVAILKAINSNYEFVDFNTYTNRGYLARYGKQRWTDTPTNPSVPYVK